MWPLVMAVLRRNAVYITLPIAGVVGFIGYNLESLLSDKYTPYSPSIQEVRSKRLSEESLTTNADKLENLRLSGSVLERNLSPSLQPKA
ncbi:GL11417 [Drosophila persimilis]|uniref:Small integral membrane protein 12-A n=2 Tax=pseudoobscura subgroup TaxID=32358 RepID=A0A6I8V447_DROPS|nr:small integral membrane protein 12-A [Drosophila persimilis]XP_002138352.2 small integral membrane protein 12-A [Drosophila pseudoobscura]XP_017149262.1 small integral membrane protein 12-A [Drosophila miranda]XP_033251040.1 small integral membrane protein 12-A-like [Drosophila miranda]EDW31996.1 GL11417 [Drosophila persimilis]